LPLSDCAGCTVNKWIFRYPTVVPCGPAIPICESRQHGRRRFIDPHFPPDRVYGHLFNVKFVFQKSGGSINTHE